MTVKEVVKKAAELLGVELTDSERDSLLTAYNEIECEIATDYLPLRVVDKVLIKGDEIMYGELKHKPLRILGVYDFQNDEVKYELTPYGIAVKKNYRGHYFFVKYNYVPNEKTLDDECEYDSRRKQLLVYGVCKEYCALVGLYDEVARFDNLYRAEITKHFHIKGR